MAKELPENEIDQETRDLVSALAERVVHGRVSWPVLKPYISREVYGHAIRMAGGNQNEAGRLIGVSQNSVYQNLKKYRNDVPASDLATWRKSDG